MFKLIKENQISWCIATSLVGFCVAIIIFFSGNSGKGLTSYGDIALTNKVPLVSDLLNHRIGVLQDSMSKLQKQADDLHKLMADKPLTEQKTIWLTDYPKITADIGKINAIIQMTRKETYLLTEHNVDTGMVYFSRYFFVKRMPYLSAINSLNWQDNALHSENVAVLVVDTCRYLKNSPTGTIKTLVLKQHKREHLMDFISDYPAFGLWIVLGIGQMMLWFMLFPLLAGNLLNLKDKLDNYDLNCKQMFINISLPATFIILFCFVFYYLLVDKYIVTNHYFLNAFTTRMVIYAIPGYMVAGFCFYNYLTLADQFDAVNTNFMTLVKAKTVNDRSLDQFKSLESAFDNAFLCSAAVLSFFVFWEGVLFNALNSTESFRFYLQATGQPLIPGDFVFLMGLLHTCILLAFYIPVRLKFNTWPVTQPAVQAATGITAGKGVLDTLSSNLGAVLVTTSPLIAGFVQSLLKVFFK